MDEMQTATAITRVRTGFVPASIGFGYDESAVTAIEYALIAALIAVACISSMTLLGNSLGNMYSSWGAQIAAAL